MNTVTLSTNYSKSIRVKNKTFVLHLATPEIIEVYGPGIFPAMPMALTIKNPEGAKEIDFDYTDEFIWMLSKNIKSNEKTITSLLFEYFRYIII